MSAAASAGDGGFLSKEVEEEIYSKTMHPQDDFDLGDDDDHDHGGDDGSGGDGSIRRRGSTNAAPPEVMWFHGKLSREDANRIISDYAAGAYLIRESIVDVGNFSIALRVAAGVRHFKVHKHELGDFYIADMSFATLTDVVSHFGMARLCEDTRLVNPVAPAAPVLVPLFKNLAVGLHDYEANSSEELSFKAGDRLDVINGDDKSGGRCAASTFGSGCMGACLRMCA
jgi:hypothetical protein